MERWLEKTLEKEPSLKSQFNAPQVLQKTKTGCREAFGLISSDDARREGFFSCGVKPYPSDEDMFLICIRERRHYDRITRR